MSACVGCGTDLPAGANFCVQCGTPVARACPSCGQPLVPGARFCMACGFRLEAEPPGQAGGPVASRRITSVLFGDLVGFTTLSESRDQEYVRELLSRYFEECAQIVARYGGVVEKFIGDAVMAVWGVPTTNEDDAERSVRAGLELVAMAAALGSEVGVDELAMRVGIVTGEVAVTIGATMQGMVAGDPVNTASRVQSAAAPGQVWVDETTRLLTSASVSYADVGSHALKGKADPVPLWAARAVIATSGGAHRADGLEAPLVGLDRELRMVKEAYHRSEESGRPALLVVAGDAGTGKSRLGWEFSKYTDGLAESCRWHAGKCVSYGEGVAYYALAEAVRSRLEAGMGPAEEPPDTDTLIAGGLAAYVDDADERAWLAPRLGALLGTSGTSSFQRDDLYGAWTTFFERVSVGTLPVVMLIDDAHYADEGLIHFVEHVLASATFPCFVMMLARPELLNDHPGLVTNRRSTVLHLDPLTTAEMAELVDGLVQGLPAGVRDVLVQRSEGIPTYAVETVRALIDRDLVVPRGGAYVLADPGALDLDAVGAPASLQALISARLDRLAADERRVVDRACVAGGSVEPGLLAELCADVAEFDRVIDGLVRAQILTVERDRLSSESGRYQFVQSAVRQVAYATLSRRDRKQTHLQVLEAQTRDESPELAPVAATHAVSAIDSAPDDPDVPELRLRAVGLLQQAASRALSLGAPHEAAGHLRRAFDLTGDGELRWELQLAMAQACLDGGDYDDALTLARAAREQFAAQGDLPREAVAAAREGQALIEGPGDFRAAIDLLEPYYHRLRDGGESVGAYVAVIRSYTSALGRVGELTSDLCLEMVRTARRAKDDIAVARAILNLGIHLLQTRHPLVGTMLLEQAVVFAREVHSLEIEGHTLATLSAARHGDDLAQSLADARVAVELSLRGGNFNGISLARVALAAARWATGEWDPLAAPDLDELHADDESQATTLAGLVAVACAQSPVTVVESSARREYGTYWGTLGDALVAVQRGEQQAVELLQAAVDTVLERSGTLDEFTSVYGAALSLLPVDVGGSHGAHALDSLLDHFARVVDDSGEEPMPGLRAHRDLVGALLVPDDAVTGAEADRLFEAALAGYEAWGSPVYLARARAAYAVWLARHGRSEEAEPLLQLARETYASLGAVAWLAEVEEALARHQVG